MFVLQQQFNVQNDRVWSVPLRDVPRDTLTIPRNQNALEVISKKGHLAVVFIDRGVKINGEYYKMEVLEKHLLPAARTLYGEERSIFASSKTELHHTQQTAFNSGATKICQILFPKLSGLPARQMN
jgi:hypothetical protein